MPLLKFTLLPCLSDNYAVVVEDTAGCAAVVDAPNGTVILEYIEKRGLKLTHIFVTHHHKDHTTGIAQLKSAFGATVVAPELEKDKIPDVDIAVTENSELSFAGSDVNVLHTPGHTLGHISYYFPFEETIFTGDTLFVMGCGRLLEGSAEMMWDSLQKLAALPPETIFYCGHEYALGNAKFALTVEPHNEAVQARAKWIAELRKNGQPVMPSTIGQERITNPFLLVKNLEEFRQRRRLKDSF